MRAAAPFTYTCSTAGAWAHRTKSRGLCLSRPDIVPRRRGLGWMLQHRMPGKEAPSWCSMVPAYPFYSSHNGRGHKWHSHGIGQQKLTPSLISCVQAPMNTEGSRYAQDCAHLGVLCQVLTLYLCTSRSRMQSLTRARTIWTLFKRAGVRRDGRHGHRLAALAAHPGLASSSPASSAPERTVTASLVEQRAVFS